MVIRYPMDRNTCYVGTGQVSPAWEPTNKTDIHGSSKTLEYLNVILFQQTVLRDQAILFLKLTRF